MKKKLGQISVVLYCCVRQFTSKRGGDPIIATRCWRFAKEEPDATQPWTAAYSRHPVKKSCCRRECLVLGGYSVSRDPLAPGLALSRLVAICSVIVADVAVLLVQAGGLPAAAPRAALRVALPPQVMGRELPVAAAGGGIDGCLLVPVCPASSESRRPKCDRITPPHLLSWPCCLRFALMYEAKSWQHAVTLDNSTPQWRLCD